MIADIRFRQLVEDDWDAIVALEARAYSASSLSEGAGALRSRAGTSPTTCSVLEYRGEFGGYLLSFPYPRYRCPDLGRIDSSGFGALNTHVHGMVIEEGLRGRGFAAAFLRHAAETAQSLNFVTISLVAVHGTQVLWSPLGYRSHPDVAVPDGYGEDAVYMSMELPQS